MKRFLISAMGLTLSLSSAWANTLEHVLAELEKIRVYREKGVRGSDLDAQEQKLLELKKTFSSARGAKAVKKELSRSQKTNKKNRPQDYLDFLRKIENKEEKLTLLKIKISQERGALSSALQTENRQESVISELRDRIDLLEAERSLLESAIASTVAANKLSAFKVGAIFDFYYAQSSNRGGNSSSTADPSDDTTTLRYYDNQHDDFALNLAEISFSAAVDRTSFVMELDFGEFAEQNSSDEVTKHIGQAFITHDFDGEHTLSVGKMYTHVGFELAKSIDNWNYSRSYTFGYGGPFWHEGIALRGLYKNGFRWGAFAYDRTDNRRDNNRDKSYGAQLGWGNEKLALIYNLLHGPEQTDTDGDARTIHEFNAQYNFSPHLSVALDLLQGRDVNAGGNGKDQEWRSLAGYVNWKATEKWRLALRSEWFGESTDAQASSYRLSGGKPVDITSHTLTLGHSLGQRNEIRFEARHDQATESLYYSRSGAKEKDQDTYLIAWMLAI